MVFRTVMLIFMLSVASMVQAQPVAFLQDMEGEFHSLGEFAGKGKWLVVMLWASDCHVCNQEAHQYEKFHQRHKAVDASILGVSADGWQNRQDAEGFIRRHKVSFPNLIGSPETVAAIYANLTGVDWRGTPTFLIFAPDGELRAQQVGAVPTDLIDSFIKQESAKSQVAPKTGG